MIFNNGDPDNGREFSSVIEIAPPLNTDGTYNMTAAVVPLWEYRAEPAEAFYSRYVSSVERLPSGNTLIGSGVPGHIFEVTTAGSVIWDFISPYVGGMAGRDPFSAISFFRVGHYPSDYVGLAGRDLN